MRTLIAAVLVALAFSTTTRAEPAPTTATSVGAEKAPAVATRMADKGPVAVPEPSAKAVRYYRTGVGFWLLGIAWGIAIPVALLFSGFSARIRNLAQRIGRKWFFTVALYLVLFALVSFVIDLPLAYYEGFVREHAYGLSNQTFSKWMGDALKGLGVRIVLSVLFGWVPFLFLKKSPRRWWLYTSLMAVPFLCFVMLVAPIWIAPLFNKFGPMQDKALEAQILSLASRAGIEGGRVFEVNKSVDTKAVNAYVNGLGGTKRIVLWDTIIQTLTPGELLTVMGHEMGHYALDHVAKSIALASVMILLTLYLAHRFADGMVRRYCGRFGFDRLSDVASLPLLMLLANLASLFLGPVLLGYSRQNEHEADRFALEITRDNHDLATAFVKLQKENLSVPRPSPIVVFFRSSHPSLGDRIDFANTYRPWERGEPLRYGSLFR